MDVVRLILTYGLFYFLFDRFCHQNLNQSAISILLWKSKTSPGRLIFFVLIIFLLFIFSQSLKNLTHKLYYSYQPTKASYVFQGKDLYGNLLYSYKKGGTWKSITVPGDVFSTENWHADSLSDLSEEEVIKYGDNPEDAYRPEAYGLQPLILNMVFQVVFLLFLLLVLVVTLSAYVMEEVPNIGSFKGDTSFVATLHWINSVRPGLVKRFLLFIPIIYLALFFFSNYQFGAVRDMLRVRTYATVPSHLTPGTVLTGTLEKWTKEITSNTNSNSNTRSTKTQYNLQIRLDGIYELPVWIRQSIYEENLPTSFLDEGEAQKKDFILGEDFTLTLKK